MAFNRFVKRYAAATCDRGFVEELGPVLAIHNAAIFNHLLAQLLLKDVVDPATAIGAQIATWKLLWGATDELGMLATLDEDERNAALQVLEEAGSRVTTLRALSHDNSYREPLALRRELRHIVRHLIVDPIFCIDADLLRKAEPDMKQSAALLGHLELLAGELNSAEIVDFALGPLGITSHEVEWRAETVRRYNPSTGIAPEYRTEAMAVRRPVEQLDIEAVHAALERFVISTHFADRDRNYWRIRFAYNGNDVAYWDGANMYGLVVVDGNDLEFEELNPLWPPWKSRLDDLRAALRVRVAA